MNRIKELLDLRGMTQRQLADKVGVTEVTISRYVKGIRTPRATIAQEIAKALGSDVTVVMGYDEKPLLNHVEMIIDYTTDGTDYQYADNHGLLVRCRDCRWLAYPIDSEHSRFCRRYGSAMLPADFCSRGKRRENNSDE